MRSLVRVYTGDTLDGIECLYRECLVGDEIHKDEKWKEFISAVLRDMELKGKSKADAARTDTERGRSE